MSPKGSRTSFGSTSHWKTTNSTFMDNQRNNSDSPSPRDGVIPKGMSHSPSQSIQSSGGMGGIVQRPRHSVLSYDGAIQNYQVGQVQAPVQVDTRNNIHLLHKNFQNHSPQKINKDDTTDL
jgi:hypothetical protein